ncbi:hypothetical protein JMG10_20640 [Nostoc ellipsosporum NOK]|jgi:hypothetical protein|nr:hypothetical protein [Nostoc ellipsosporum NOK]
MRQILPFFLLLGLFACRDKKPASPVLPDPEAITPVKLTRDTSLTIVIAPDTSVGPVYGSVENGKAVSCYLRIAKPVQLQAELVALTPGLNLRFNQLFMPDGSSDGPFGNTLTYRMEKTGTYRLVLGPNLMAEGQTTGDYLLRFYTQ